MRKLNAAQEKLLEQSLSIRNHSTIDRDELGFSTRLFVQCNLPHRDPGAEKRVWTRTNGNLCFSIQPKWVVQDGLETCIGYPYGNIPRLILLYVCTQAIRTKRPDISLGNSLSAFMRDLGLEVTGGRGGTITRFKDQFRRLFTASIDFTWNTGEETLDKRALLAHTIQLWWDTKYPEQTNLFNSFVVLTDQFYNEIMSYPVPVDMGMITAIKQSPLALDLYTWLTHRVLYLDKATRISWTSLAGQVGSDYADLDNFVRSTKEALAKIYACWPELKIDEVKGGLILKPSKPSVSSQISPFHLPAK